MTWYRRGMKILQKRWINEIKKMCSVARIRAAQNRSEWKSNREAFVQQYMMNKKNPLKNYYFNY